MEKRKIALIGGTLIDGNGGTPLADSLILIEGENIVHAGSPNVTTENYEEVFIKGNYVLPGLVECHVHLGGVHSGDPTYWVLEKDRRQAIRAVKQAEAMLAHGFTTVRDISENGIHLRDAINAGEIQGPRIFACGRGLTRTGGHGDSWELPVELNQKSHPWAMIADGEAEVRKTVRRLLKEGADCIKVWASGGGLWERERETDQHYSLKELQAMAEEAAYYSAGLIAHCESLSSIKAALKAGVESIEHGEMLDQECIAQMSEKGVFLVPTFNVFFDWFEEREPNYKPEMDAFPGDTLAEKEINRIIDNFQRARKAGVKFAVGADSFCNQVTPYGAYSLKEIHSFVRAGCTEMETIVAATKRGAQLLHMEDQIGTVEAGKYADLVVLKKNPLEDICNFKKENLNMVMKGGERYSSR